MLYKCKDKNQDELKEWKEPETCELFSFRANIIEYKNQMHINYNIYKTRIVGEWGWEGGVHWCIMSGEDFKWSKDSAN